MASATISNPRYCIDLAWRSFGLLPLLLGGCMSLPFGLGEKAEAPRESDSMTVGAGPAAVEAKGPDAKAFVDLAEANLLFEKNDFVHAEKKFRKLADNKKNPTRVLEEARFKQAECQVLQNQLSKAEATYKQLINEHRYSKYVEKAGVRLYEIANYWLDDTRKQMEQYEQKRAGKIWFVPPNFIHFSQNKPFLDEEGRALQCLEAVVEADNSGPLKEKALFYLGTVYFFRCDYREADHWYSMLWDDKLGVYNKGQLAQKAIKQSIICKQVVNGGSAYDRRTLEHARKLVERAKAQFPELAVNEKDWLEKQVRYIHHQQADGDFNVAEFYRRVGKPGAAYFYYELVRRRYQGSEYADLAARRMDEIRTQAENDQLAQKKYEDDLRNRPPGQQDWFAWLPWRKPSPPSALLPPQSGPPSDVVPVGMTANPGR